MAYTTKPELATAAGGMTKLLELADLDNTGDLVAVDAAIARAQSIAEGWIHSYAQRRYAVPFSPVTDVVKQLAADETIYRLVQARRMVTTDQRENHEEREKWLENLAKGLVSPGVDPEPPSSTNVSPAIIPRDENESVSRKTLEKW